MGYASINADRQRESDVARIKELKAQLKKERESKREEQAKDESLRSKLNDHVTIEKTSKALKRQLILAWVSIFLGVIFGIGNPYVGGTFFVIGVFALVYTKIQIWWRHG